MMTLFKRKKDDEETKAADHAADVKATITTAAVKAEALVLVSQLKETLARLDKVLQEGVPEVDQVLSATTDVRETGGHGRPDA